MRLPRLVLVPVLGVGLLLVGCGQSPAPEAADPAPTAAEVAAADTEQASQPVADAPASVPASQSGSKLTGSVSGLGGNVSGLRGLVSALGGEMRGTEIYVALPADTLFDFDKADVLPGAEANLSTLAELIGKTEGPVRLVGHTDAKGDDAYNQALSERRAAAVQAWLQAHGVADGRLQAQGRGASEPVAPNQHPDGRDNPEGRAKNRRVEAIIPKP